MFNISLDWDPIFENFMNKTFEYAVPIEIARFYYENGLFRDEIEQRSTSS